MKTIIRVKEGEIIVSMIQVKDMVLVATQKKVYAVPVEKVGKLFKNRSLNNAG